MSHKTPLRDPLVVPTPHLGLPTGIYHMHSASPHVEDAKGRAQWRVPSFLFCCIALHAPQITTSSAEATISMTQMIRNNANPHTHTHTPEEQEMRKTAKASLVASPIFHPNLILQLEQKLKR